jgi:asparagine N-glycosylation enzyme membrane subunit Stt3
MIEWFTIGQVGVAALAGTLCVVLGLAGRRPSDLSVGAIALVQLLLIAQIVVAAVAPLTGNEPTGSLLEFWTYLVSAALLPVAGVIWAFIDRSRWSVVVMGVLALAVAVMVYRMHVIWTIQGA